MLIARLPESPWLFIKAVKSHISFHIKITEEEILEAEKMLIGERLTTDRIEVAAQVAAKLAKPMDNTDMTLSFRKKMVTRFVTKSIKEALDN